MTAITANEIAATRDRCPERRHSTHTIIDATSRDTTAIDAHMARVSSDYSTIPHIRHSYARAPARHT